MELNDIKEIIKLFSGSNVDLLEIEKQGLSLKLGKEKIAVNVAPVEAAVPVVAAAAPAAAAPAAEDEDEGLFILTSPIVGTFYRSPSPDADPFVEAGDTVRAGQTLCIVEAMKLMNEIQAEKGGVVAKFFVENGEGVEFGQKLMALKLN